jgi:IgA Peptidase M64
MIEVYLGRYSAAVRNLLGLMMILAAATAQATTGVYAVVELHESESVRIVSAQRVTLAGPIITASDVNAEWSAVVGSARVPISFEEPWRIEYDRGDGTIASARAHANATAAVLLPDGEHVQIQHRGKTVAAAAVRNAIAASEADLRPIGTSGDSRNRVDLLLVGDGYTAGERAKFFADAQKLMASFFAIPPYRDYAGYFNLVALFVPSAQSGADHPPCSDPASNDDPKRGQSVDTAFDARYCGNGVFRGVTINPVKVYAAAAAYPEWDRIGVIVNDDTYGGSGGPVWVVSTNGAANEIAQHEFGHTFARLTDEYTSAWSGATFCSDLGSTFACEPNATDETSREKLKWLPWIDAATPVPTPPSHNAHVGLFEGARYRTKGFYRPRSSCLMNHFGVPFCEICREAFVLRLYEGWNALTPQKISLVGETAPSSSVTVSPRTPVTFSATTLQTEGNTVQRRWSVNGNVVATDTATFTFTPDGAGTYEIRLEVVDATSYVRPARESMSAAHTWQLRAGSFPRRRAVRP